MFNIRQEFKIKTTMKYHFTLTRTSKIKKKMLTILIIHQDMSFLNSLIVKEWFWSYFDISYKSLTYFPKKNENICPSMTHTSVYTCFVCIKTTQIYINIWVQNKLVHAYNGILITLQLTRTNFTWLSKYDAEQKKPDVDTV